MDNGKRNDRFYDPRKVRQDGRRASASESDNKEGAPSGGYGREDIARLAGMSQDQLMAELVRGAGAMKSAGTFDIKELEDFCTRAAAFLSPEQLQRMRSIIDMLK